MYTDNDIYICIYVVTTQKWKTALLLLIVILPSSMFLRVTRNPSTFFWRGVAIHSQGSENAEPNKYQNSQFFAENPMVLMLFKWDVYGRYIPIYSPKFTSRSSTFIDVDLSLALPSRWHLRIGGSPTPQGPLRREAAPRKTARARRGGTTAPREDGKHGAGQRRVEQRKFK